MKHNITDQFAIASGDNHVYANSYLIQPETTSAPHQVFDFPYPLSSIFNRLQKR